MLEHVNVTVSDPQKTAAMLSEIFGWHIRWQGKSGKGGDTVHVGTEESYVAVYSTGASRDPKSESYVMKGGLNHIGIVVDDLDATEQRVSKAGYTPHSHGDYEPGHRFYFHDHDGIEFEVVSYAA